MVEGVYTKPLVLSGDWSPALNNIARIFFIHLFFKFFDRNN